MPRVDAEKLAWRLLSGFFASLFLHALAADALTTWFAGRSTFGERVTSQSPMNLWLRSPELRSLRSGRGEPVGGSAATISGTSTPKVPAISTQSSAKGDGAVTTSTGDGAPDIQPVIDASAYHWADEIDQRPLASVPVAIDYPADPGWWEKTGRVVLIVYINRDGSVDGVEGETADLPEEFLRVAAEGFKRMRFYSGTLAGEPVATKIRVEVQFLP